MRSGAFVALSSGTLGIYELNRLIVPQASREQLADAYCTRLVEWLLQVFGVQLMVRGELEYNRGALVVANHQSALDIAVMLGSFHGVMVSRHEVAQWPLFGRLAKHGATIFVDRDNRLSGAAAVRAMRRRLREGRTVVAFPEGATHGDDALHEFKPGAFASVGSLELPIVPVGLAYAPVVAYGNESFGQHIRRIASSPSTRICMHVGKPIQKQPDARQTAETARERVGELMAMAREELDAR